MTKMPSTGIDLLVNKKDLRDIRMTYHTTPSGEDLTTSQILLKVDLFSFTSNNITYAAVGDSMRYWDFFPAEDGWGKVPCWGFANVVYSNHTEIEEGERLYGYFPMSTHLIVQVGNVNPFGFYDVSSHRQSLPMVYNHYIRTKSDPAYQKEFEPHHSIFQPLFATSFLLDDYLSEHQFMEADHILSTSASSKTAIAFAYLLHSHRANRQRDYKITGLTSARNVDFVKQLNIYDEVVAYDDIGTLEDNGSALVVDFAGNKALLLRLQDQLTKSLKYFCNVGLSHWENSSGEGSLHVANEFFFAPAQAEKRTKQWGGSGLRDKMAAVYIPFLQFSGRWMEIKQGAGHEAVETIYREMVDGKVNPAEGHILSMHDE